MWSAINTVMSWFAGFDRHQWLLALVVGMVLGVLCMRGFGSRSNY